MKHAKKIAHRLFANLGILVVTLSFMPMVASAQIAGGMCNSFTGAVDMSNTHTNIATVLNFGTCLVSKSVIPLLFSIAILVFIWGVIRFIREEKAEEREKGKQFMIWGIIAFTVMLGVWGLVGILGSTFGISNVVPQLPVSP